MALFSRTDKVARERLAAETTAAFAELGATALDRVTPIADAAWRERVKVAGRVRALRIQPWSEKIASLELTLMDGTGGITVVFLGRRTIGGIHLGTRMVVQGTVSEIRNQLAVLNPSYQLLPHEVALPF